MAVALSSSHAAIVTLTPSADTSLSEFYPTNNLGAEDFLLAGTSEAAPTRHRALLKFDLSAIPPGSRIAKANLLIEVTHQPANGYTPTSFELHRLLKDWGEGTKRTPATNSFVGQGLPAGTNEACWNSPLAFTTNLWTQPGALVTNDFSPEISSQSFVYDVANSPYLFDTSAVIVQDLQSWLNRPSQNFGWILKSSEEVTKFTARRFASSEYTNAPPILSVEFIPPPLISGARISGNHFYFNFLAESGQDYAVQFQNFLGTTNPWNSLTNIPAQSSPTNIAVVDPIIFPIRFYQVVSPLVP